MNLSFFKIPIPFVFNQIPHLSLSLILVSTIFDWKHKKNAEFGFHAIIGGIFLLMPQYIYKPTIVGKFDEHHNFLQRFPGAFHIGLAVFYFLNKNNKTHNNTSIQFSKAITGLLLVSTRLFFAYHLFDTKARGIYFSSNFLTCVLLIDGVWTFVEIIQLILNTRKSIINDLDVMNKQSQQFLENKSNFIVSVLFWIDSAIGFVSAIFNFTYANDILKILISRKYHIDEFHMLYTTESACHALAPAITSLFAVQFTVFNQLNYIRQRILTQFLIIALKIYGFYSLQHLTTAYVILIIFSFCHLLLLICIAQQISKDSKQKFFNFKSYVFITSAPANNTAITNANKKTTKIN